MDLARDGWSIARPGLTHDLLEELRSEAFSPGSAGVRCLLDFSSVKVAAEEMKQHLIAGDVIPSSAVAIQAIAFDKTPDTNWKVPWHQDLMFPFSDEVSSPGYDLPSRKTGVHYARPPVDVLESLLAVRLHLDDCDETNGPLRVSPGTHLSGIIPSAEAANRAAENGEVACLASIGEALLMRPLLLHASSQATEPGHRRVLHVVYHSGAPMPERWHRFL
ncbi:phytanoyl-CoA dioxygenase family protein [Luteolibacter flavescens]|uniref:Phytanoyl-CoA dioxygenase family protein n=1 Tax=Luteolibacter flavescens TaxID=1859460 RepID=A0ABT3FJF9_9BACT|nr:phytanoyl-CoA dioxygenase family protein [Luteolibacter flavescens]MCW1883703.1 phytanoyl-CoA dioxygenase family protein [Luteolibacter flavescens]